MVIPVAHQPETIASSQVQLTIIYQGYDYVVESIGHIKPVLKKAEMMLSTVDQIRIQHNIAAKTQEVLPILELYQIPFENLTAQYWQGTSGVLKNIKGFNLYLGSHEKYVTASLNNNDEFVWEIDNREVSVIEYVSHTFDMPIKKLSFN